MKLRIIVDIGVIRRNVRAIRKRTNSMLMLMLKSDAYGHGLEEVARSTEDLADAFGVVTLEEGLALRRAGITKEILLLACAPCELKSAIDSNLTIGAGTAEIIDTISDMLARGEVKAENVKLQIAVDSGMHRLGFDILMLGEILQRVKRAGLEINGIYTHLRAKSRAQVEIFDKAVQIVKAEYPTALAHIASSHHLNYPSLIYDMVRVGVAAYEGAMSVESEVIAARRVKKGEFVSYGNFRLKRDTNVAVVFGGYADGVKRENPSCVYIRGRACPVLGNVCMDMCIVDAGEFLPSVGERAILLNGEIESIVAKERATITYTVMTGWHGRVERLYKYD